MTDDDNNITQILDIYHPQRDRAVAGWDRTNVFNITYVYTAPDFLNHSFLFRAALGGWELNGITRVWSGTPFSVTSSGNAGNLSGSGVRADYNPQIGQPLYTKTFKQYFNPLLFTQPQNGTLGNTGRNQFRGPGINNWNIAIFKNIVFNESTRIQLRLETFNTFNHTQFATVLGSISPSGPGLPVTEGAKGTRGNSGQVGSTYDPRQFQLGGKFFF